MRLKDPLYSRAENDSRRRSAQSALLYALRRLLTAIAPILSFTAEEAWQEIPADLRGDEASVFDSSFDAARIKVEALRDDLALWEVLRTLRAQVAANPSGRDFELGGEVFAAPALYARLESLGDNLREALVLSHLHLSKVEDGSFEARPQQVELKLFGAHGEKCARCWKFRDLGSDPQHPSICSDCAGVVRDLG